MRSQLTAQFMQFFRLIAHILTFRDKKYHILTFCNKKYHILTFCDKTELYLTVLQQNNVEACLRCEASLSFVLSGSLLLSEFAYNILARLTRPLLSSQRRCCAATLYAALVIIIIIIIIHHYHNTIIMIREGGLDGENQGKMEEGYNGLSDHWKIGRRQNLWPWSKGNGRMIRDYSSTRKSCDQEFVWPGYSLTFC